MSLLFVAAVAALVSLSTGCGGSTAAKPDGGGTAGSGSAGRDGGGGGTGGGNAAGTNGGGAGAGGGSAAGTDGGAAAGADGGGAAGADGGAAGTDGGGTAGVDGGGGAPDGHGFSCVPPLICPDGGAKCGSGGTCQAIDNAYTDELVLHRSCTLNTAGQCLHRVAQSLEYLCPNLDAWVNDSAQLDNLRKQWDALGCSACFSTTCPTGTPATTSGLCKSTTIAGPQGPITTVECENQP
jgi:hypothetical protein